MEVLFLYRQARDYNSNVIFFLIIVACSGYRFQEKNFDLESENQVLQQALLTPAKQVSDHLPSFASKVFACEILH